MSLSKLTKFTSSAMLLLALAGMTLLLVQPKTADAASTRDFRDGNIIDDGVFYNKNAMSVAQIQDFLNRLIPNCDTWGTSPSEFGGGTRAQYAASRGWHGPPYACLNNYHENPTTFETSFEKGGGAFAGGISAAQIIYNAAQQYGINPQVLLVLLKKESAGPLTADTWPLKSQYKYAMGYACPDSGPGYSANCDDSKAGFYRQMMLAAWQLKYYRDHPNDYRYSIGWNDIQYSPDPGCGTKRVNIENISTLSLYIYTPYTPNEGALANYPGTAPCGAYGNRNFFMFFSEWFGSTRGSAFKTLDTPRWMKLKTDGIQKKYVYTGEDIGSPLEANRQIRFTDKILIDSTWYLRTEYDQANGLMYGIPHADVVDIPYQSITPKWITLQQDASRSHPASRTGIPNTKISTGTSLKVVDSITVDSNLYYRTEYSKTYGQDYGIHSRFVTDFNPISLESPRNFCSNETVNKVNPQTGSVTGSITGLNQTLINKKTLVNGVWYYQSQGDNGTLNFFNRNDLKATCYLPFEEPRSMQLNADAARINPYTSEQYDVLSKGRIISLSTKILIDNQWFYRTSHNTQNNIDAVIPASAFTKL